MMRQASIVAVFGILPLIPGCAVQGGGGLGGSSYGDADARKAEMERKYAAKPAAGRGQGLFGALSQTMAAPEPAPAPRPETSQREERSAPAPSASDIDSIPYARPRARRDAHAIVIGIERYRQKLPKADYASSDARLFSRYLTQVLGFSEENVATLLDDQAAKSDFEKYFERWLPNRVEKGDEVFVFYSGHGAPNPQTGDAFLVPYDGDPTYLAETAYPIKKLYAQLAKLPAGKVTVALDSCFSGAGGRSVIAKGARPLVNVSVAQTLPENVTVMSASAGDQTSHGYDEKGHGLFTYFLLKGIGQQAGQDAVDLRKAFDFAAPQVSKTARREYNSDQAPQWQGARP